MSANWRKCFAEIYLFGRKFQLCYGPDWQWWANGYSNYWASGFAWFTVTSERRNRVQEHDESSDFCYELLTTNIAPTRSPELRSTSPYARRWHVEPKVQEQALKEKTSKSTLKEPDSKSQMSDSMKGTE
jgi:hypothetical protein